MEGEWKARARPWKVCLVMAHPNVASVRLGGGEAAATAWVVGGERPGVLGVAIVEAVVEAPEVEDGGRAAEHAVVVEVEAAVDVA